MARVTSRNIGRNMCVTLGSAKAGSVTVTELSPKGVFRTVTPMPPVTVSGVAV